MLMTYHLILPLDHNSLVVEDFLLPVNKVYEFLLKTNYRKSGASYFSEGNFSVRAAVEISVKTQSGICSSLKMVLPEF